MTEPDFDGYEWDADKNDRCRAERGFDFDYVKNIFRGDFVEWADRRWDYGEERFVTVGTIDEREFTVIWTPRNSTRRIISARPASRSERERLYGHRKTQ